MQPFLFKSNKSSIFKNLSVDFVITFNSTLPIPLEDSIKKPTPYGNFNIAYHVGDDPKEVLINRKNLNSLFYPKKPILYATQVHGDVLLEAPDYKTYKNPKIKEFKQEDYQEILLGKGDSIACKSKEFKILLVMADCPIILIWDEKRKRLALVHAGRKGIRKNIITKTYKSFFKNSSNEDIYVYISPHIHKCCYEISASLACELKCHYRHLNVDFLDNKNHMDLLALIQFELQTLGIKRNQIESSNLCTCHNPNLYSYRRSILSGENGKTGRMGFLACLKE